MPQTTPLGRFEAALKSRAAAARRAAIIVELAPRLPESALPLMDRYLDRVAPLVQVAIMDAYFEMTGDDYHEEDLIAILEKAARAGDDGEELYMAVRLALARVQREPVDDVLERSLSMVGVRALRRKGAAPRRRPPARPAARESLTIVIHGTWASAGTWWRPGGDFHEYFKRELEQDDLYSGGDLFVWSGRNDDGKRREAALSLADWLRKHPAAEVNVLAHSHGANVAMLATHSGATMRRLVMLSPPVRRDYLADWSRVGTAYNIQAAFDPVVAIAKGGKWFRNHGTRRVKEKELKASGHSASHEPEVWRAERLAAFVGAPWS